MSSGSRDEDEAKIARNAEMSFVAKAKGGVYKATEIVREEATAVDHMAQCLDKLATSIDDDVDHVETALHQMIIATNSKEEVKDEIELNPNDLPIASTKTPDQMGSFMAKDNLALEWSQQTIFHAIFIFLTLSIVLLHKWGNSILGKNDMEATDSNTLAITKNSAKFSVLVIYIGTIWRVVKFMRNATSKQKRVVIIVEEKVHEVGQEVKNVANNIEEIAQTVEHISQQIEEEAGQIESLISPVPMEKMKEEDAQGHADP